MLAKVDFLNPNEITHAIESKSIMWFADGRERRED
jgi:hypothetical protein